MSMLFEYNNQNNHNSSDTESTSSENTEYSEDEGDYSYEYNTNFQINFQNNFINKNILLIPEIYNKYFHGRTFDSDPNIDGQFLVLQTFYINHNSNMFDFFKYVNNLSKFYKNYYKKNFCRLSLPHNLLRNYSNIIESPKYLNLEIGKLYYYKKNFCRLSLPHNLLRNYSNIIESPKYLNLEIGKLYYLKGNECVCVLKTFWLRLVQRAWKKIYKMRQIILQYRRRPDSLFYKQFSGKWPENCSYIPSIKGMLVKTNM